MINSESEVNAIIPTYTARLGLIIRKTDIGAQKINSLPLVTYEMVLVDFLVQDKFEKVSFFEKTFLLVDISIEVVLKMPFFTFLNINIQFV